MRKKFWIVFVYAILFSTAACAETGIYIDAESGWAEQGDLPSASDVGATNISSNSFTPYVWLGDVGYNHDFNRWVGMSFDVGSGVFGRDTYHFVSGNSSVQTVPLSFLLGVIPHYGQFDFIFKGGLDRSYIYIMGLNSESGSSPLCTGEFQAGLAYRIIPHVAIEGTYLYLMGKPTTVLQTTHLMPSVNAILLGLRIIF